MKWTVRIFLILLPFFQSFAQGRLNPSPLFKQERKKIINRIIKEVTRNSDRTLSHDSMIKSLQGRNNLIVGFSTYNIASETDISYYLLCFLKKKCIAYQYIVLSVRAIGEKRFKLDSFELSLTSSDSLLYSIRENKVWQIKHNDTGQFGDCSHLKKGDPQKCAIDDGVSKSLICLTKNHQTICSYYAPESYEHECCPGNKERQAFLAIGKLISNCFERK